MLALASTSQDAWPVPLEQFGARLLIRVCASSLDSGLDVEPFVEAGK
jgi:hypothetical protein